MHGRPDGLCLCLREEEQRHRHGTILSLHRRHRYPRIYQLVCDLILVIVKDEIRGASILCFMFGIDYNVSI